MEVRDITDVCVAYFQHGARTRHSRCPCVDVHVHRDGQRATTNHLGRRSHTADPVRLARGGGKNLGLRSTAAGRGVLGASPCQFGRAVRRRARGPGRGRPHAEPRRARSARQQPPTADALLDRLEPPRSAPAFSFLRQPRRTCVPAHLQGARAIHRLSRLSDRSGRAARSCRNTRSDGQPARSRLTCEDHSSHARPPEAGT